MKPDKILVEEAQVWWRLWSVRLSVFGAMLMGMLTALPDAVLYVWLAMPPELKELLPTQYLSLLACFIFVGVSIARVIRQHKLRELRRRRGEDELDEYTE